MLNFFLDRDIIPIEISFDRDMKKAELVEIFESIKSKIGAPRNYALSKEEQKEVDRLKREIAEKEAEEKIEFDRKIAKEALDEREKQIEEMVKRISYHHCNFLISFSSRPSK